jgi:hypothetical protein
MCKCYKIEDQTYFNTTILATQIDLTYYILHLVVDIYFAF